MSTSVYVFTIHAIILIGTFLWGNEAFPFSETVFLMNKTKPDKLIRVQPRIMMTPNKSHYSIDFVDVVQPLKWAHISHHPLHG